MTDQALMVAAVALTAMLASYLWMAFALGSLLRKLDERPGRAWIPVWRWVAAAKAAHQPATPVAIARSVGLAGLVAVAAGIALAVADAETDAGTEGADAAGSGAGGLASLLADSALADVAVDARAVLIGGLVAGLLGTIVGWGLWVHGSGTIEMRLRAPAALSWLAALAPVVWASVMGWGKYGRTGSLAARLAAGASAPSPTAAADEGDVEPESSSLVAVGAGSAHAVSPDAAPTPSPALPLPRRDRTGSGDSDRRPVEGGGTESEAPGGSGIEGGSGPESLDTAPITVPGGRQERWRGFGVEDAAAAVVDEEPLLPDPAGPSTGTIDLGGRWDELRAGAGVDADDGPRPEAGDGTRTSPVAETARTPVGDAGAAPDESRPSAPTPGLAASPYLARSSSTAASAASAPSSPSGETDAPAPAPTPAPATERSVDLADDPNPVDDGLPGWVTGAIPVVPVSSEGSDQADAAGASALEMPRDVGPDASPEPPAQSPEATAAQSLEVNSASSPEATTAPSPEATTASSPEATAASALPIPTAGSTAPSAPADDAQDPPEDPEEQTIVVKRRNASWVLEVVGGARYRLPEDSVVVGRATARPSPETLAIEDSTRTMSKVHAELTFEQGGWYVRDLGSTNGTYLRDGDDEWPVVGDRPALVEGTLLLGDLEARILPDERRG
ncbi:FHA domain-containing protein [uncultured Demequina sp.]|uniref:FHA domain-containing protein n=1 Tax=uncultured Demequina sp. TaxID=693499 RepID=UPI0025CDFD73|nr:FHA domain-containing protein [uncultured Demequina sp.]